MSKAPARPQHETQPAPTTGSEPGTAAGAQPTDTGAKGADPQPIEPDPAGIVDTHRTERPVEDMGGEID